MARTNALLALTLAAFALVSPARAVRWDPIDVTEVDNLEAVAMSRKMAQDESFRNLMIERYFFSGPEVRADFLTALKGGVFREGEEQDRQNVAAQVEQFKMLPLSQFHYLQMKGTSEAEIKDFCKKYGLMLHVYRKASVMGVFSKTFHVLVSGTPSGVESLLSNFQYNIEYQDPVTEFRIELKYKVNEKWYDFAVPTGERYRRDFGMVDVYTAAGIFSKIQDELDVGVRKLIDEGVITLHQGSEDTIENIVNVKYAAFLPFVKEPFIWN